MTVITDQTTLELALKEVETHPYITIDTEFLRDKTYYSKLCLVQIGYGDNAIAIDALSPGISLEPLNRILINDKILKVFHSCKQDIEIFYKLFRSIPTPIFDTQIAAMVIGYGEAVSYDSLVKQLVNVQLDKTSRFTDWSRRPLTQNQIDYALADVIHLGEVYQKLQDTITKKKRDEWLEYETKILYNENCYRVLPEEAWKRIKFRGNFGGVFQTLIQSLAEWREKRAQTLDYPRGFIVRDQVLLDIAATAPDTLEELQTIKGIKGTLKDPVEAENIMSMIHHAKSNPSANPSTFGKKRVKYAHHYIPALNLLKILLHTKSDEFNVASKLIASIDDLHEFSTGNTQDLAFLSGWRYDIFGKDAESLMKGELCIGLKGKKVAIHSLKP